MEYLSTALIHAPRETVWRVLTNSAGYADWNPEIVAIDGAMALNERIKVRVRIGSGAIRDLTMRVTALEPLSRLQWTGGLPLGLFTGVRTYTLAERDGRIEFKMHLRMTGLLAPLIIKSVGNRQPEIDRFSASLRAQAERLTTGNTEPPVRWSGF